MNHLIQANNTASPPDGRPHSLRHRAHSQPGAQLTQRKAASGKGPGVKMQEISPLRIAVIEELLALKLPDVQLAAKARQQIVIIIGRDRQRMAGNLGKLVAGGRQIAAGKGGMLQPRPR